jgi:hypothetical protein
MGNKMEVVVMAEKCRFLEATKDIHYLSTDSEISSSSPGCKVGSSHQEVSHVKDYCLSTSEKWARCPNYEGAVRMMK